MRIDPKLILPVLVCGCPAAGYGQDPAPDTRDPEAGARALVEDVLAASSADTGRALDRELAEWAQSIVGNATPEADAASGDAVHIDVLNRHETVAAGSATEPVAGTDKGAEVIVFMSLAVPEPSWRQWSAEAARTGAPMVLRGFRSDGFMATVRAIGERRPGDGAGAAIDPRLFRLFRIAQVPAVAVVPGGVPPCATRGCSDDPPPPHDLVTGNIGLEAVLEIVSREGGPGREAARRHLAVLRGERN